MRILLINPPMDNIIFTTQPPFIVTEKGSYPPLGLLYIATMIKTKTGHKVKIVDCQLTKMGYNQIKEEIIKYRPDVVGITLITSMLIDALKLADIVKECAAILRRDIIVVGGGPHATIFPDETISRKNFDYVFSGEAEHSFLSFVNNINDPASLRNIPGIVFKENGTIVKGPPNSFIEDLDSLPIPDRRLLDYKQYKNLLARGGIMTTSITSRGCPYRCIFCERLGKRFRAASAQYVIREIEDCLQLGIDEIFFHDDTFTIDKKRVMEICRLIEERKLKFRFSLRSRVDTIDEEMIRALKRVGCRRISFGVESGVQRILDRIKKGITLKQAEDVFTLTKKYRITTLADFMIGHPDESLEDIYTTLNFAKRLNPDYVQFSITTPYPATELYREAISRGIVEKDIWREFTKNPRKDFMPPRWEQNLKREQLDLLLNKCYREFYLRPSFILKMFLRQRSRREMKRKAKAGFSLFKNTMLAKWMKKTVSNQAGD